MKKIIPCLDTTLDEKGNAVVVKGVEFEELKYAGDPVELARKYDQEGADELVFLDITASTEGRERMADIPRKIVEQISIPLCVGGGVRTLDDFRKVFDAGADKASVNTAAVKNPKLIQEAVGEFGSERVVAAIDCKRAFTNTGNKTMIELEDGSKAWYDVVIYGGKTSTGMDAVQWALEVERLGAGEILLTSKDRDGTKDGYDIPITRAIAEVVDIPVIASGGCGNLEHMYEAFINGVDACLAASIFHYGEYTIKEAKEYLKAKEIPVRI